MIRNLIREHHQSIRRVFALTRKETWQILCDPSAIAIGVILPLLKLVLFGYAISMTRQIYLEDSRISLLLPKMLVLVAISARIFRNHLT